MVLTTSGSLSFSQIRSEMGGTGAISLGNYYASGSLKARGVTGIPTAGTLSVSAFRGKTGIPVVDGLIAKYTGESWTGSVLADEVAATYNASTIRGTIHTTTGSNSKIIVYGGTDAGLQFPAAILPPTYTMFHIARYNGSNRARIIDGVGAGVNFLSGFYNGYSGCANHEGWVAETLNTDKFVNTWILSTDQNSLYRANQLDRTTSTAGNTARQISINYGNGTEWSDWAFACMMIYNRTLSLSEIALVEQYLISMYAIPIVTCYNYYTVTNRYNSSSFVVTQSQSDPDVRLQLNSLSINNSSTSVYAIAPLQSYTSFVMEFEVFINSSSVADGICVNFGGTYFGTAEWSMYNAFGVSFQVYTQGGLTRGLYLYNNQSSRVASSAQSLCNSTWTPVRIVYTKGTSNTWRIYYNGNNVITYSDTNNSTWLATAGNYWSFGCRNGGSTGEYFIRRLCISVQN